MAYFNRDDRSGGGGNRSFGRRDFGGRGGTDRQMFRAICSNCGKECQVPFQPSGSKPVYCSDCFEKQGRDSGPRRFEDRAPRRFEERGPRSSNFEPRNNERPQNNDQFRELNSKLDKILSLLQPNTPKKQIETVPSINVEEIIKLPDPPASPAPKKKAKSSKKAALSSEEIKI